MFRKTKELEKKIQEKNVLIIEQNRQISTLMEFYKEILNIAGQNHYNSADNLMNKIKSAVDTTNAKLHF